MAKACAASFCRKVLMPNDRFYPFPHKRESIRLQVWQKRLLTDPTASGPSFIVCHRHFSDRQLLFNREKKQVQLKRHALPDKNIVRRPRDTDDPLDAACRLCLERSTNDYQMIFPVWPNPDVPTAQEIADLFGITVTPDDSLPRIVCVTCISKIKYIKKIRDQFQKNDTILRDRFLAPNNDIFPPIAPARPPAQKPGPRAIIIHNFTRNNTEPTSTRIVDPHPTPLLRLPQKHTFARQIEIPEDKRQKSPSEVDIEAGNSGNNPVGCPVVTSENKVFIKVEDISEQLPIDTSGGEDTEVMDAAIKTEPTEDTNSNYDAVHGLDIQAEDHAGEWEDDELKIEYNPLDVGSTSAEEDSHQAEELEEEPPEKKHRIDKPFRGDD